MRFGCCGSMISPRQDLIGLEIVEDLAALGFDYVELSIRDLAALPKPGFSKVLDRLRNAGIRCESCNNFFPGDIRLTGHDASLPAAVDFAARVLERAAELGASVIVFGSAGAKNVPPGFSHADARRQIIELLRRLGPIAGGANITIVIEPLNRRESNLICTVDEGFKLVREVNDPHVQLLVDYYHLRQENEGPDTVLEAGDAIRHLHFAEPAARGFPLETSPEYEAFFSNLRQIGYQGRCSIEAYTRSFLPDAKRALAVMRSIAAGSGAASQFSDAH